MTKLGVRNCGSYSDPFEWIDFYLEVFQSDPSMQCASKLGWLHFSRIKLILCFLNYNFMDDISYHIKNDLQKYRFFSNSNEHLSEIAGNIISINLENFKKYILIHELSHILKTLFYSRKTGNHEGYFFNSGFLSFILCVIF